jgi:hypothetical protein
MVTCKYLDITVFYAAMHKTGWQVYVRNVADVQINVDVTQSDSCTT